MSDRPTNAFVRELSPGAYEQLSAQLEPVNLQVGEQLHQPEDRLQWVYLPTTSLLSMISITSAGEQVETALVGNEGASGVVEACGSGVASTLSMVQIGGRALRTSAAAFRRLVAIDEEIWSLAWRLVELQMAESRQSGMCHAMHEVEPRLARWLLESRERCGGRNPIPMTHEFLSALLGVQRTTITAFAARLQKAGLISYARGVMEITDPAGLEAHACECRKATRQDCARLRLEALSTPGSSGLKLVSG